MGNSIFVVLFVILASLFAAVISADALVDKMDPSIHVSFRGYDSVLKGADSSYEGMHVPTELTSVSFTVPSSAPNELTFKLFATNFCTS